MGKTAIGSSPLRCGGEHCLHGGEDCCHELAVEVRWGEASNIPLP